MLSIPHLLIAYTLQFEILVTAIFFSYPRSQTLIILSIMHVNYKRTAGEKGKVSLLKFSETVKVCPTLDHVV